MNVENLNNNLNDTDLQNDNNEEIRKSETLVENTEVKAEESAKLKSEKIMTSELKSEEIIASEKSKSEEIKTPEESKPEEIAISGETKSEEIKTSEEPKPEEITISEETKSEEIKTPEQSITLTTKDNEGLSIPDYSNLSKAEILDTLKQLVNEGKVQDIKIQVNTLKSCFYKHRQAELADLKRIHIESGKDPIDFDAPHDIDETYLKELLSDYKIRKAKYTEEQESIKRKNLSQKQEIIEKIKILANGEESLQKTFEEFREIQKRWKEIGSVPREDAKGLWESYNLQIERFYDFIKINNELRDLDFKKNIAAKIALCEKSEALLLESKIVVAYKTLQNYHEEWREIGPVTKEKREELWERFSLVSKEINKRHQEYFIKKKEERENNLNAKVALCEKLEAIANQTMESTKNWNARTEEIMEIQKIWKTIGMVPQKHNNIVYERFRSACNVFFEKKQDFFKKRKQDLDNNLQKKINICIQAEALKDNTNWNKTRDEFIKLQDEWKIIGPTPKKQSDETWKRFRAACDTFFETRSNHFKQKDGEEKANSEKKKSVIEEIKAFKPSEDKTKNLEALQKFQNEWTSVGHVPMREKEKLQSAYKSAIEGAFKNLDLSISSLNNLQFQKQVEEWIKTNNSSKIENERQRINQRIKKIKEDSVLLENNMSFFKGGSSESVLKDVKKRIDNSKKEQDNLLKKRKTLDLALRNITKESE